MAFPKIKISDDDGNTVGVDTSSNALNVKLVESIDSIDIGDVSLLLGGTAASVNAGTMDAGTLRVTLATDDTHWGTVGTAADIDGTAHGQLRYIGNAFTSVVTNTSTTATNTANIAYGKHETGTTFDTSDIGIACAVVRNDTLANLDGNIISGDYSILQTDAIGALYVTGASLQSEAVKIYGFSVMGEAKIVDGSALPNTVSEGDATRLAVSRAGVAYTCLTDDAGLADLGSTITTHLSEIEGAVETIEGAISGSEMQVDIVNRVEVQGNTVADGSGSTRILNTDAAGHLQVDVLTTPSTAVTNAGTFAVQSGHDITGLASDDNPTVGTSAEKISGADGDVACKRVDIMAHPDNTGHIWIGDSAVTVNGLNGGIRLAAGDFYSMDIDNTGDVYAIATVDGENVCFNYFT